MDGKLKQDSVADEKNCKWVLKQDKNGQGMSIMQ